VTNVIIWSSERRGPRHPYAIGDLHGEVTLLQRLLEQNPSEQDCRLIFLGDYLDRGEDSIGTIAYLAELATQRDCIFLRGNHDAAWLESWNGERFAHRPVIPGARAN
jgi:serine/threonine protein phosphatase 1